jgi:hypothetical protein
MKMLQKIGVFWLLFVSCLINLNAAIRCPQQLSYEQLSQIKARKFKYYNQLFSPIGDFSLPWTSITAKLVKKNLSDTVYETTIHTPETVVECIYEYQGITGSLYKLRVMVEKPENVSVMCISQIEEVSDKIKDIIKNHPEKLADTIAVFDWDETISKADGEYELRDENKKLIKLLELLKINKIPAMVLTARGYTNRQIDPQIYTAQIEQQASKMTKALENWSSRVPALKIAEIRMLPIVSTPQGIIFKDDLVFTRGGKKGLILSQLIDDNLLVQKPKNIIFVENDPKNIEEFAEKFRGRKEKVSIFHYPAKASDNRCQLSMMPPIN